MLKNASIPFTLQSYGDADSVRRALRVAIAKLERRDGHRSIVETIELRALERLLESLEQAIKQAIK